MNPGLLALEPNLPTTRPPPRLKVDNWMHLEASQSLIGSNLVQFSLQFQFRPKLDFFFSVFLVWRDSNLGKDKSPWGRFY